MSKMLAESKGQFRGSQYLIGNHMLVMSLFSFVWLSDVMLF